jgi:lysophospholipase L1-like esterase
MKRRQFLGIVGGACGVMLAGQRTGGAAAGAEAPPKKPPEAVAKGKKATDGLQWVDVRQWPVEGKGWKETERFFDRLPAKAKAAVRPAVWSLSRHSAGMCVRFETDSPLVAARWSLLSPSLAMDHMPATGVSGLDLYARDEAGRWRWLAVGRPTAPKMEATLAGSLPPGRRAYCLYLPLYNGVEALEVGVAPGAAIAPLPPRATKPMVFYGTSIVHGGCASRPGMAHPAILGRRLDRAVVNLGFSGNGTMDIELATLFGELDACVYVIDCLPNMAADQVAQRTEPFVRTLRQARPKTPIVLVEDRTYANAWLVAGSRERHAGSRAALRRAFDGLAAAGVSGLHYLPGDKLLGDDGEATVDSSHPTDLGFVRMADALEPVLRPLV